MVPKKGLALGEGGIWWVGDVGVHFRTCEWVGVNYQSLQGGGGDGVYLNVYNAVFA